jgi:hypothetical protein
MLAATLLFGPVVAAPIQSAKDATKLASVDILSAQINIGETTATFRMTLAGTAGETRIEPVGQLNGAPVHSYVWPTSLDPATVGFEPGTGILALAATHHPDFDDTPLSDESADGQKDNDGAVWHSHWVVLTPNPTCGKGALAVRDIPEGETPQLPATWPGLPLFIDSPDFDTALTADSIEIALPLTAVAGLQMAHFDAVTAALRVNADLHAPLLCVTDVFDVASGDLSLPGTVD